MINVPVPSLILTVVEPVRAACERNAAGSV